MDKLRKIFTPRNINIIGIISIIYIVASRYWKLDKGLIFSDEGWYVTLLRDNPSQHLPSRFQKLFQFGLQDNIYGMRLLFCVLLLGAILLFGYSVYKLQKSQGKKNTFFNCLTFIALGSLQAHSISTPNYINMNLWFGLLAVSFSFLYLSTKQWYYNLLSALFACFLFTTQVLGVVLIPVIYIVNLLWTDGRFKMTLSYAVGIIVFFCVYFCIEPPASMLNSVAKQTSGVVAKTSGDYGLRFLIEWTAYSFSYIFKFLVAAILFYVGKYLVNSYTVLARWKTPLYYLLFILIIGYINVFVNPHCNAGSLANFNQLGISYFLAFLVVVDNYKNISAKNYLLIALLLFVPFALCLGTNTGFAGRYSTFLVFLLPAIFVFASPRENAKNVSLLYFTITLIVSIATVNKANWMGDRPTDQNISVKTIGIDQHLYLTEGNIKQLAFCQQNIKEGAHCFSTTQIWGIAALLNLQPVTYNWRLPHSENMAQMVLKELTNNDIVVISTIDEKFNYDDLHLSSDIKHRTLSEHGVTLDFISAK